MATLQMLLVPESNSEKMCLQSHAKKQADCSQREHWRVIYSRAPIDQLISHESLASPNLVGDRAAHPVCDHYLS